MKPLVECVSCDLLSDPFPFFTSLFCNDKIANYLADDYFFFFFFGGGGLFILFRVVICGNEKKCFV